MCVALQFHNPWIDHRFGFERFKNGLTALASPAETKILNKADHYFSGCEATCSKVILDWIRSYSLAESLESVTL